MLPIPKISVVVKSTAAGRAGVDLLALPLPMLP
jgi:hypothetical protein